MRKLRQRHAHWAPCKSIKNQSMTESTMDMWQLDWCICALCRADISASTFRLALQILNGCGTEVVERCGSSNDQSTVQQETAGCYSTMKCIYPTYNILQNNECWSTRQAGPRTGWPGQFLQLARNVLKNEAMCHAEARGGNACSGGCGALFGSLQKFTKITWSLFGCQLHRRSWAGPGKFMSNAWSHRPFLSAQILPNSVHTAVKSMDNLFDLEK